MDGLASAVKSTEGVAEFRVEGFQGIEKVFEKILVVIDKAIFSEKCGTVVGFLDLASTLLPFVAKDQELGNGERATDVGGCWDAGGGYYNTMFGKPLCTTKLVVCTSPPQQMHVCGSV